MGNMRAPFLHRHAGAGAPGMIIHASGDWLKEIRDKQHEFFTKLARHAASNGVQSHIVAAGQEAGPDPDSAHVHIMVGGRAAYAPNILHAKPAYIWGFWYLDEIGTCWNSSLRFSRFCQGDIDPEKATYFFNGVAGHMLRENVSKLPQEVRMKNPMKPAAAVIYCQEIENRAERSHYLTTEEMIRITAATCKDELVYVKPHPEQSKPTRRAIMEIAADFRNVRVSNASVHDLTEASRMVVTQNSAAGFEALMQRRCVITCAKSDYWHASLSPKRPADLREALKFGADAMAGFPYEKYLYWFLGRNCLEPAKDTFARRAWSRIRDKAFL